MTEYGLVVTVYTILNEIYCRVKYDKEIMIELAQEVKALYDLHGFDWTLKLHWEKLEGLMEPEEAIAKFQEEWI